MCLSQGRMDREEPSGTGMGVGGLILCSKRDWVFPPSLGGFWDEGTQTRRAACGRKWQVDPFPAQSHLQPIQDFLMNVDTATDSPQLTQIQKVNACLRCLIQVSLLFSMYRLWGGGGAFGVARLVPAWPRARRKCQGRRTCGSNGQIKGVTDPGPQGKQGPVWFSLL